MATPIVIRLTLEDGRMSQDDPKRSRSFMSSQFVSKGTSAVSCLAEAVRNARTQFPSGYTVEFAACVSRDSDQLASYIKRWLSEDPDTVAASAEDARRIYVLSGVQLETVS